MSDYLLLFGGLVCSTIMAIVIIPNIIFISYKRKLFDMPNGRKVHSAPVSRLGGVAFFPTITVSFCLILGLLYSLGEYYKVIDFTPYIPSEFIFLLIGCTLLFLIGITDDIVGAGYRYKFLVQIIAASLLTLSGHWIDTLGGLLGIWDIPAWLGMPMTVFVIVYITNAINLIDGIDGLASGLSIIALLVFGATFIFRGQYVYGLLTLSTLGVLIPFWATNVFGYSKHHHKLFMGDTGSLTLGFIISFIVIKLCSAENDPLPGDAAGGIHFSGVILAMSALFIPLVDVVRVVLHRISHGHSPFLPDRNHIHHKLLETGLKPRMVMLTILLLSVFFIAVDIFLARYINITILLIIDVMLWMSLIFFIDYEIKNKKINS